MTGFGVPRSTAGGTTTADIQRIIAAEYSNAGIIDGCNVTGTATLEYDISAGAVILDTGPDMAIKVPVAAQRIPAPAPPATGSADQKIYVEQRFPSADNPDNSSLVAVTTGTVPPNSIVLDVRRLSAGATATSSAPSVHNRKFARPVGSTLGRLHMHTHTDTTPRTTGTVTRGAGDFYVPTDRDADIIITSCVSASSTSGATVDEHGSVIYKVYLDGSTLLATFERKYDRYWETKVFNFVAALSEGYHTIHYTVEQGFVPAGMSGRWAVRYGGANKFPGDRFHVYDRGVIRW